MTYWLLNEDMDWRRWLSLVLEPCAEMLVEDEPPECAGDWGACVTCKKRKHPPYLDLQKGRPFCEKFWSACAKCPKLGTPDCRWMMSRPQQKYLLRLLKIEE